jgi:hypothetical protein
MLGHDNYDQTLGQVSFEQEQDSWNRNQAGQDKGDRTDRTGQIGQDNRDGKTISGKPWDRIADTDSQDMIAKTGQPGQDSQIRQSGQYIQDRKHRTILS